MHAVPKRKFLAATLAVASALFTSGLCWAQHWPAKPITILVPQAAGAIQDLIARTLGAELTQVLNQPVIVDNRPSASQVITSAMLTRAAPDGYTLMISAMPNVIAPNLLKSQPFAGNQDFTAIAYSLSIAGMLAISPQISASNLKEFVALLKASPDRYTYGSSGVGTPLHMFLAQFNRDAGTQSIHIPYKSFQMITPDVSTNLVSYSFLPLGQMQLVRDGKLKSLGFVGAKRDPQLPDLPTLDEQGLKGFDASLHYFVIGPKGMPADIVAKLNSAINTIQAKEAYRAKYRALGGVTVPQNFTPSAAEELLRREDERYTTLVKEGKIKFE